MTVYPNGKALPCFICDKVLQNVTAQSINQPSGGTVFLSQGHYGSTVFDDPLSNSFIEITICDDCFVEKFSGNKVLQGRKSTEYEYDEFFYLHPQKELEDLPIEDSDG